MAKPLTERQKMKNAQTRRMEKRRAERIARDERIFSLRSQGWTLEEVADAVGITYQRVGQILNKESK